MPPPDKPNVARLPPDEQIAHLTHQYETLHDRIQCVEEGQSKHSDELAEQGKQLGEVRQEVSRLRTQLKKSTQLNKDNNLLLREMNLFLRGQQTPGMEVPGMNAKFAAMEAKVEKWDKWHNRAAWVGIGLTGSGALTLLYYAEKVKTVFAILFPHK
jgi:hypothetical protein